MSARAKPHASVDDIIDEIPMKRARAGRSTATAKSDQDTEVVLVKPPVKRFPRDVIATTTNEPEPAVKKVVRGSKAAKMDAPAPAPAAGPAPVTKKFPRDNGEPKPEKIEKALKRVSVKEKSPATKRTAATLAVASSSSDVVEPVAKKTKVNGKAKAAPAKSGTLLKEGTSITTVLSKVPWTVGARLGSGGHGEVFLTASGVAKVPASAEYAVKVEPVSKKGANPLDAEKNFYRSVGLEKQINAWRVERNLEHLGMPRYHGFGQIEGAVPLQFIIIDRLGAPLDALFQSCDEQFSEKTSLQLALELLNILEYIHANHYSFGDMKNQNIMVGYKDPSRIFLADFGLATLYYSESRQQHEPYLEKKGKFDGTREYACRDAHRGVVVSRRGDIESLGYLMIRWLAGTLPWMHVTNLDAVAQAKQKVIDNPTAALKEILNPVPEFLLQLFSHVKKLAYDDEPAYDTLRSNFLTALKKGKAKADGKYDWM